MRIYIIGNERHTRAASLRDSRDTRARRLLLTQGRVARRTLSGQTLPALWNALPGLCREADGRSVTRDRLIAPLWSAIPRPAGPDQPSEQQRRQSRARGDAMLAKTEGATVRRKSRGDGVAAAHGPGALIRKSEARSLG